MRLLTTVAVLVGISFCLFSLWYYFGRGSTLPRDMVSVMGMILLSLVLVPSIFFVTEKEALGRRVAPRIPRGAGMAAFVTPFLPGGARGIMLFAILSALVTLFVLVGLTFAPPSSGTFFADGVAGYLAMLVYGGVYLLLPSGLLASFSSSPQLRAAIRVLIPFLAIIFGFAPSLLGFFLDDDRLAQARHAGNPVFLIESVWERGMVNGGNWLLLIVLLVMALALNAKRLWYGIVEVSVARRARLEREARQANDPPSDEGHADAVTGA